MIDRPKLRQRKAVLQPMAIGQTRVGRGSAEPWQTTARREISERGRRSHIRQNTSGISADEDGDHTSQWQTTAMQETSGRWRRSCIPMAIGQTRVGRGSAEPWQTTARRETSERWQRSYISVANNSPAGNQRTKTAITYLSGKQQSCRISAAFKLR